MADVASSEKLARILLVETREELAKADQKANLLLAALGVAIAALMGAFASAGMSPTSFPAVAQSLFWSGCFGTLASLTCLGKAVFPYLGRPEQDRLNYFADVSSTMSCDQALSLAANINIAERDMQQFVVLAKSLTGKYRQIRRGMIGSAIAVPILFVGALLGVSL